MNWVTFFQQLMNGVSVGSLYALLAIGYTLVYGILGLINFAHSDVFMLGTYFAFFMMAIFLLPWWLSVLIGVALCAVVGMSIERVAYRPLRNAPRISALITAVGVSFFIENLGLVTVGARPKGFPRPDLMKNVYILLGARIQGVTFWVPVISILILFVLFYIVYRTKIGIAMRAVSRDMETTRLMGVDVDRIILYTFALGSALAGIGGVLWACKYPQINPLMGIFPGWKAFTAAVVGGIGNVVGAMLGGFIIGLAEILIVAFFPGLTGYRDAFVFTILIVFLLVRPGGLMGEAVREKV
ncbi:ABC transporter permease subunit [Candidatus Caldatribacterium saccharofermentans]|uniref:Branched-chain amino acid ABC transporter permease n=1 Tax=Candidatus Caldatribacterium saccharofermentans TaxID=1454753 RepID=A0A7V4WKS3_9BACT